MSADAPKRASAEATGLLLRLSYGSGQAVDSVLQAAINTFLLFYLTAVCGMSGSAAGSIFLVSLVVDALLDPFIGQLSDNWRSRWGRRLPFMATAILPMMIAAYLLFSVPANLPSAILYAYVLGLNVILRVSLSVFALPHSALTAELTSDYAERSVISMFRALFIVLGTAAILLPAFLLIFGAPNALQSPAAYPHFGMLTASLVACFGISCILGTFRRLIRLPLPDLNVGHAKAGFFAEVIQLFRNPSFVPLFIGAILVLVGQGATGALNLHAFRYFWQLPPPLIQLPLLLVPLGMLIGTAAAGPLLKRIEKRDGVIGAVAALSLYQSAAAIIVVTGMVMPGSIASIALVAFEGLLFGACGTVCFVCFYSAIADAVDEHDHLFGIRREALYAAALMIGAKAATGIGGFLAGLGLQLIGFSTPHDGGSATTVPAGVATGLGLLWGPCASIVMLLSIVFLKRYRVDRARHAQILIDLAARHQSAAPPSTPQPVIANS